MDTSLSIYDFLLSAEILRIILGGKLTVSVFSYTQISNTKGSKMLQMTENTKKGL